MGEASFNFSKILLIFAKLNLNSQRNCRIISYQTCKLITVFCWPWSFPHTDAPSVTTRVSPPGPVVLGTMVDLVCEATAGDTPISFSWRDGGGVAVFPGDTDGTISVTLSSAGDYGTYTCTAVNDIGNGTATVDVIQASKHVLNLRV